VRARPPKRTSPLLKHPRALFAWYLALLYAGIIYLLSSARAPIPFIDIRKYPPDWILHGVEYAFFGILLIRACALTWERRSALFLISLSLFIGVLYGISDEWHQSFVPGREAAFHDLVADTAGVFAGAVFWNFFLRRWDNG
jgi:hypothetical protein